MVTLIGSHEIKNFTEWKKGFDADEINRSQAGIKTIGVYTSVENPNDITFILEAPTAEIMDEIMSSPKMHDAMKNAGVVSKPIIKLLNKV